MSWYATPKQKIPEDESVHVPRGLLLIICVHDLLEGICIEARNARNHPPFMKYCSPSLVKNLFPLTDIVGMADMVVTRLASKVVTIALGCIVKGSS